MERIPYQHHVYSDWGIESFPPLFKANNIRQVLDFQANAITEIDMATKESLQNTTKRIKFFFEMQHHPLSRLLARLNTAYKHGSHNSSLHNPYLCFFDIQETYHWPTKDPCEEKMISLTDLGERSMLEAKQPSTSDIRFLSPFPDDGSSFSWEAVREASWNCAIGLKATYAQRPNQSNQTDARYSLIYIHQSDEINKRGRREPIELVSRKQAVAVGLQI